MTLRSPLLAALASVLVGASLVAVPAPLAAQAPPRTQVVSANPFGLMLEWFNVEYERVAAESFTVGVGASTVNLDDDRYANLDLFGRFYPQEQPDPFRGWSFGLKVGLTQLDDKTYVGGGFDVDHSWLLGKNDNFYVGIGGGLKRLWGHGDGVKFIPTVRVVNIGIAF